MTQISHHISEHHISFLWYYNDLIISILVYVRNRKLWDWKPPKNPWKISNLQIRDVWNFTDHIYGYGVFFISLCRREITRRRNGTNQPPSITGILISHDILKLDTGRTRHFKGHSPSWPISPPFSPEGVTALNWQKIIFLVKFSN